MWTHMLTAQDYQDLLNRNWRRSGKYCYKAVNKVTCCPLYTIKCDALNFKLSKSHKKILKRMSRFLKDGRKSEVVDGDEKSPDNFHVENSTVNECFMQPSKENVPRMDIKLEDIQNMDTLDNNKASTSKSNNVTENKILKPNHTEELKSGPDPSKPLRKKAKQLRIERKKQKLAEKGISFEPESKSHNTEKTLEQFFMEHPTDGAHKLEV